MNKEGKDEKLHGTNFCGHRGDLIHAIFASYFNSSLMSSYLL